MSIAKNAMFAAGALALFGASFVGFSLATGKSLPGGHAPDTVPGSKEVATKATPPAGSEAPKTARDDAKSAPVSSVNANVLGAFVMPAPFSSEEIAALQNRLHDRIADADARLAKIQKRESELDEREHALEGRAKEFAEETAKLDAREKDLRLRRLELERDEAASGERDSKSWKDLTKFFLEGDADELAKRLATFEPKDAAKILRGLDDDRAGTLLNALSTDKYKSFLEAYRKQGH